MVGGGINKMSSGSIGLSTDDGVPQRGLTDGVGQAFLPGMRKQKPQTRDFFCQSHPVEFKINNNLGTYN